MIQESYNLEQMSGLVTVVRKVVLCVFAAEGIGAVGYAFCFVPELGLVKGLGQAGFYQQFQPFAMQESISWERTVWQTM